MRVNGSASEGLPSGRAVFLGVCLAALSWPAFLAGAAGAAEKRDCSSVAYDDDLSNLSLAYLPHSRLPPLNRCRPFRPGRGRAVIVEKALASFAG